MRTPAHPALVTTIFSDVIINFNTVFLELHQQWHMRQCTKSGSIHFYLAKIVDPGVGGKGVNALSRAQSISTLPSLTYQDMKNMCQCPKSGSIHFYAETLNTMYGTDICVNALSRAQSISTWKR